MPTLKQSIDITLQVPVAYKDAEGKQATRSILTFRRPTLKQAKQLAVIGGQPLASLLMREVKSGSNDVDMESLVTGFAAVLLQPEALDALTQVIADMAGENIDIIDRLDWLDLIAVFKAFFGFFPKLQSAMPDNLQQS